MTITMRSRETLTPVELYKLTKNATVQKLSSCENDVPFTVGDWVIYEDVSLGTGEVREILSLELGGVNYATNSPTFIREFKDIVEVFGADSMPELVKVTGVSKAGRTYMTCVVV